MKLLATLRIPTLVLIACGAFALDRSHRPPPDPPVQMMAASGAAVLDPMDALPGAVERVTPAVVSIFATRSASKSSATLDPFGLFGDSTGKTEQGLGSGVIVRAGGIIVTNNHVVDSASELRVVLADRREFRAKLVGRDPQSDVAVLRIAAEGLPTVSFGDSSRVRVGETVMAIGNSMGVGQTVSCGIVSATGRANVGIVDDENFIQTDAPINPGNSGGPLVNLDGEVIGINTAIATRTGGFQGIGFAIPSRMVDEILQILLREGRVSRGQLGVVVQDLTPALARALRCGEERGVIVTEAAEKGAAREAGLRRGDLIVAVDGEPVSSTADLRHRVALRGGGAKVRVDVWRDAQKRDFMVRLKELGEESEPAREEQDGDEEKVGFASGLEGIAVAAVSSDVLVKAGIRGEEGALMVVAILSRAPLAGLRKGDLIVEVNHATVRTVPELREAVKQSADPVLLRIRRSDGSFYVSFPK
jgi:serine protease Do